VAETTVGITEGPKRVEDRCHRSAVEKHGEQVTFEHAGVGKYEPFGGVGIDRHPGQATRLCASSVIRHGAGRFRGLR